MSNVICSLTTIGDGGTTLAIEYPLVIKRGLGNPLMEVRSLENHLLNLLNGSFSGKEGNRLEHVRDRS